MSEQQWLVSSGDDRRHTQPWPAMIEPGSPAAAGEEQLVGGNSLDLAVGTEYRTTAENE